MSKKNIFAKTFYCAILSDGKMIQKIDLNLNFQKQIQFKIKKQKRRKNMLEYKFDTQLLIEGKDLSDEKIKDYITQNIEGDCLLVVGDDELIKLHFHTNTPWKVLEYCDSLGDIQNIIVENMQRQADGLNG